MKIKNNTIEHHLRNVLFICGTSRARKTTMARMLAEKHGFYLYDMDERYHTHRAIALPEFQPEMCYHMTDFHQQWTRPIQEQALWSMNSLHEQTEIVLLDLIQIAKHQRVVADVLFSPAYTQEIIEPNQLIFLTVDKKRVREYYFNRPEKQSFYEFIKKQEFAETYLENIFQSLELTNELEQTAMRQTGFLMLERKANSTKEEILHQIEQHFGLLD